MPSMRACDVCRKRKKQCKKQEGAPSCMTCQLLGISACTFLEPPPRKRRLPATDVASQPGPGRPKTSPNLNNARQPRSQGPASSSPLPQLADQDDGHPSNYPQNPLLNKTLGLEQGRFSEYLGPGGEHDWKLLRIYSNKEPVSAISATVAPAMDQNAAGGGGGLHVPNLRTIRTVHEGTFFQMVPDADLSRYAAPNEPRDKVDIDEVQALVHPHGPALISLYFRIVHPSFQILHKEIFIEKYNRSYREIVPHLLASVYALAIHWWPYDADLFLEEKVDETALVKIAHKSVQDAMHYPRLNTIQAGLLLLQRHRGGLFADNASKWSFTSSLIGLGQHLGLHLDCSGWAIPEWEKGLRRRLAWALFIQDAFSAMIFGRPCNIWPMDWAVLPLQPGDFSEGPQDEEAGKHGGSASIEDGKLLLIELAKLSTITSRVLRQLYSVQALATVTEPQQVVALVRPLENELAQLLKNLHPDLQMNNLQQDRLCINGFLHLAFQATAATLQRRLFWALQESTTGVDAQFARFFRIAQRQHAANFVQLVYRLRPEHMEAFWFFAAGGCGVILGGFLGLLRATSTTADESEEIKALMTNFEWQLLIKAKMGEWVSYTLTRLKALGWDRWKTLEPDFDANATPMGQGAPYEPALLSNAGEMLDLDTFPLYSTTDRILPGAVPAEISAATWLTEDVDGWALPFWNLEGV